MSLKPLHPHVAASLAELCIARMEQLHSTLPSPGERAGYHVERAAHAELELCTLIGAIAGADAEARITSLFFPKTPLASFSTGPHRLHEAQVAAGAAR